jgi:hypothetical protein
MTRKTPVRHKVDKYVKDDGTVVSSHMRGKGLPSQRKPRSKRILKQRESWMLNKIHPFILTLEGKPNKPYFLVDENLPKDVELALRERGYPAVHVTKIFKQGTPDEVITKFAEDKHAHVLTRDIMSFPEPKLAGDRIVIIDVPGERSVPETINRLQRLGIIK